MIYIHQLKLLLWKNYTLKKRSPFVVLFEIFIPLVIFFTLIGIRKKQPAYKHGEIYYRAQPLPSAGVIPVMRAFCDGGESDEYGLPRFPNSTVERFLRHLNDIAQDNRLFHSNLSPDDMDAIPSLYRRIVEDPASLHDQFVESQDTKLDTLLDSSVWDFLHDNFSLSNHFIDSLRNSTINNTHLFTLLFGNEYSVHHDETYPEFSKPISHTRRKRSVPSFKDISDLIPSLFPEKSKPNRSAVESVLKRHYHESVPSQMLSQILQHMSETRQIDDEENELEKAKSDRDYRDFAETFDQTRSRGALYYLLTHDKRSSVQIMNRVSQFLSHLSECNTNLTLDLKQRCTDEAVLNFTVDTFKSIALSPIMLRDFACNITQQRLLLKSPEMAPQYDPTSLTQCNLTEADFESLSRVLNDAMLRQAVIDMLRLHSWNYTQPFLIGADFVHDLELYTMIEEGLFQLSSLASSIPLRNCNGYLYSNYSNISPQNATEFSTPSPPTEDMLGKIGVSSTGQNDYEDALKLWLSLRGTLCGNQSHTTPTNNAQRGSKKQTPSEGKVNETDPDSPDKKKHKEKKDDSSADIDIEDILPSGEKQHIGILLHLLYSNPKIVYAPNNTDADKIIKKANETFELIARVSDYARKWLNISADLHIYLDRDQAEKNLISLRQIQSDLKRSEVLLDAFADERKRHWLHDFIHKARIPHTQKLIDQLDLIDHAACTWLSITDKINLNVFRGFRTEDEFVNYALYKSYFDNVTVFAGLVFKNMGPNGTLPPHLIYKIRQNATLVETTKFVRAKYWFPGPRDWGYYYYRYGFIWIQDIIERAVISLYVGRDVAEPGSFIHQMPYPCYIYDHFFFLFKHLLPLCLVIAWVYPVAMLCQNIVHEKEAGLKEVMKMMGLQNSVHWLAWFITSFLQMTVTTGLLTLMLKAGKVLYYADGFVLWFILEVYAIASIMFSFLISVLYAKAKLAAACAGIIYFLSYVPCIYIAIREVGAQDHVSDVFKSIASLLSPSAFGLGAKYISFFEEEAVGVSWSNLHKSPVEGDSYNLMKVLIMMAIDSFVYGILVWYIEHVHPGSYGLPKPWYFPFTTSYWFGNAGRSSGASQEESRLRKLLRRMFSLFCDLFFVRPISVMEDGQAGAMHDAYRAELNRHIEPEPFHLPLGVRIDNLSKQYKSTGKLAVDRLSLNLYEGQITAFLGHNGAGKTTTMAILTGLIPPSNGYATIYGHDIRVDMDEIRKSLGMCPQHNVLFDKLTVEEHLWFYGQLKCTMATKVKAEMDTMINDIGLPLKRHNEVCTLSGGMKRKLSVAIAFVAGSKTIILDEPTAGVDPYSRRAIWDLLIKYKKGRTILLSTHHMDEADILGDRIAVISSGQLRCCGTSLFLKTTFGDGYYLTLVKKRADFNEEDEADVADGNDVPLLDTLPNPRSKHSSPESDTELLLVPSETSRPPKTLGRSHSFLTNCRTSDVTRVIKSQVVSAYLHSETAHELQYILPFEETLKGNFEKLFQCLDRSKADLYIDSYGVMDTSLEEVFLRVTESSTDSPRNSWTSNDNIAGSAKPSSGSSSISADTSAIRENSLNELALSTSLQQNLEGRNALLLSEFNSTAPSHHASAEIVASNYRQTATLIKPAETSRKTVPSVVPNIDFSASNSSCASATFDVSEPLLEEPETEHESNLVCDAGDGNVENTSRIQDLPPNNKLLNSGSRQAQKSHVLRAGSKTIAPRHNTYESFDDRGGIGSHTVSGHLLVMTHFLALIAKRFNYVRRNWKALFSQILLPSLFVCIAMTVALSAPHVADMPELVLSPAQYFNFTQPKGNYVPIHVLNPKQEHYSNSDAGPMLLNNTLYMPSGISATCVLKSPFNSSFDKDLKKYNITQMKRLVAKYFNPGCQDVFNPRMQLNNFVPPPPTPAPAKPRPDSPGSSSHYVPTTPSSAQLKYYPHCSCTKDGSGFVCESSDLAKPPETQLVTRDVIVDISTQNATKYLLYTTDQKRLHRYGGLTLGNKLDYVPEDFGDKLPPIFRRVAVRNIAQAWYNNKGYHSMAIYLNALNNAILRANLLSSKGKGNPAAYGITLISHPMNKTDKLSMDYILDGSDVIISIFIIVAMSFVPASFVLFLVYERSLGAKHLQTLCGVHPLTYWFSNFFWDMMNYSIPMMCILVILKAFDLPEYVSERNFPAVIALLLLYGWSITPMMYPASFLFRESSSAYIFLIVINLFIGITCILTSFLLEIFSTDEDLARAHNVLKFAFLVFPNYCLGRGLMDLAFTSYRNQFYILVGQYDHIQSPFRMDLVGRNLVAMSVSGFIFFIITLLLEYGTFSKKRRSTASIDHADFGITQSVDELGEADVSAEKRRVLRGAGRYDLLRLENLSKIYTTRKLGKHLAVDNLCLGVPVGECFGLLGVNGAGKTSTFRMLTGDLQSSSGQAFIGQHSALDEPQKVRHLIGYCPQFDALFVELTAREHLSLYCRLRGVPLNEERQVVEWAIKKLALTQYADKPAGSYSGGTKRKLSTAIALIGRPQIIFLDEPTTGMDPHSRRFLWDLIIDLINSGRSVILTSHSMEECESLCTRLAIMVNGRFECIGSVQHLKTRYGRGYTITVRLSQQNLEAKTEALLHFMQQKLRDASLKEQHYNSVQFEVDTELLPLERIFSCLEDARRDLAIEDYSVSQNTLDNVFINFVKRQTELAREIEEDEGHTNDDVTQNSLLAKICSHIPRALQLRLRSRSRPRNDLLSSHRAEQRSLLVTTDDSPGGPELDLDNLENDDALYDFESRLSLLEDPY